MANQRIIVITNRDNVATALEPLAAGETVSVHQRTIVVRDAIANGHKVALERIASGVAGGPDSGATVRRIEDPSAPRIAEPPDPDPINARSPSE